MEAEKREDSKKKTPSPFTVLVSDILIHHREFWKRVKEDNLGFLEKEKETSINCTNYMPGTIRSTVTWSFTLLFA